MKKIKAFFFLLFLSLLTSFLSAQIQSPEDYLGFRVGADRKLADMHQIIDYFLELGNSCSRVAVKEVGKTTMGNPFIVAVITSENNHKELEKFRGFQQALADPRSLSEEEAGRIISQGKTIVMINCSIHASEIGAAQMSLRLAYDLAVKNDPITRRILDNVILLLVPMHNPDGIQLVVDWYKKNLGTPYEGCRMPWLYNKYVGHDNNRDWYMLTQIESRLTIQIHNAWHPQIVLDMHQMGRTGARMFVPPYVDPFEPNVDPILRQQVAVMGTFIASELTAEGKAGVIHSQWFDAWTPARAYHHYHGGIRILTELAGVKVATPVTVKPDELQPHVKEPSVRMPLPWEGGVWRLGDIVEYDYSASVAVLKHAAALRYSWIRNFYLVHKKAVAPRTAPFAYLVPAVQKDKAAALEMLDVLQMGGVEVHQSEGNFQLDEGSYPAGTNIIFMAQPYGGYAKALLERQSYPDIREYPGGPLKSPYDVVAHSLPLFMGVNIMRVDKPFKADVRLLEKVVRPKGKISTHESPAGYIWTHTSNEDFVALNRLLKKGYAVFWFEQSLSIKEKTYPPGAMIVKNNEGLENELRKIADDLIVDFNGVEEWPSGSMFKLKPVRLGLYKSWTASMDEGWTRWILEKYEYPYRSVFDNDIKKGEVFRDIDVLILPDMLESTIVSGNEEGTVPPEYAGGIGEAGIRSLKKFVKSGGTLITVNASTNLPLKHFYIAVKNGLEGLERKDFFVPGSLLMALNDTDHPIAFGCSRESPLFFRRSPAFEVQEGQSVVKYPANCFLSGWINGEEHLFNKSALTEIPYGKGKVILIGFPVLYRAQALGTFCYLFNAIHYGPAVRLE